MPKVRRKSLPEAVFRHLLRRARERGITYEQMTELTAWLNSQPEVPNGPWFKWFPGFAICGEGELVKTFLVRGQAPVGREVV